MAGYFDPGVAVPSTAAYAPPAMDFSWLANLPNAYYQGRQMQRQDAVASAFPAGLPKTPDGNIDYRAIANTLAAKGDVNDATGLFQQIQMQDAQTPSPFFGGRIGGGMAAPGPRPAAPTSAAAQMATTVSAPARVTSAPLPPVSSQQAPADQTAAVSPALAAGQTDQPVTVSGLVASLLGGLGDKATGVATNIARAVGVQPDAPLSNDQQQRAYSIAANYAQRNGLGSVSNFTPFITSTAEKYGLDPSLFNRQINRESGGNPNVRPSSAGAKGIAQFTDETAKQYGVNVRDPYSSIDGAARYMADLKKQFGNDGLALAAYDWGPQRVARWLSSGADPRRMPKETRDYVQGITGQPAMAWAQDAQTTLSARTVQPGAAGTGQTPAGAAAASPGPAAAPAAAGQRLTPQVPLPDGFNDPQQAILALRNEAARRSTNPYAQGQVKALNDWADRIERANSPLNIGDVIVSPTGEVLYATPKPVSAFSSAVFDPKSGRFITQPGMGAVENGPTLDADAERYRQTGTLPPNMGRGAQGAAQATAIRQRAEELAREAGEDPATWPAKWQDYRATGAGKGQAERTKAVREENLKMVIKAANAAIPAALEESEKLARTGWVPLNKIIQGGQVIASDPRLKTFGMANLQLAEHWARAMNPTGVMRESDRDLALHFLSTADSQPTYRAAVMQLKKQIEREYNSIRQGDAAFSSAADAISDLTGGDGGSDRQSGSASASAPPPGFSLVK